MKVMCAVKETQHAATPAQYGSRAYWAHAWRRIFLEHLPYRHSLDTTCSRTPYEHEHDRRGGEKPGVRQRGMGGHGHDMGGILGADGGDGRPQFSRGAKDRHYGGRAQRGGLVSRGIDTVGPVEASGHLEKLRHDMAAAATRVGSRIRERGDIQQVQQVESMQPMLADTQGAHAALSRQASREQSSKQWWGDCVRHAMRWANAEAMRPMCCAITQPGHIRMLLPSSLPT